jgi:hypothetical protein
MGIRILTLGGLLSLLTSCVAKPPEPTKPGVSAQLRYPIVLVGQGRVVVKDDELSLTTTTVASGLNFPEFTLLDASGAKFSIRKVTDFGRKSTILDMGTTPYRVFLPLKSEGTLSLAQAKALIANPEVEAAHSIPELIEALR